MIYNEIDNNKNRWIILIHCVCGNENIFKKQMDMLNKHYNIAVVRLPGHGIKSEIKEATFDFVIQNIHEFVLRKKCRVEILGVSIGAMIATKYISIYPEDVIRIYAIGNIYGFSTPFFKTGYMVLDKLKKILPSAVYMYFITKVILPGKKQKEQRKKLYENSMKMKKEFLYSWMHEMAKFIIQGKIYFEVTLNNISNISLIYGRSDKIFLGWVKRSGKTGLVQIIEDAGHLCNIDKPDLVNTIIEEDFYENIGNI